MRHYAKANNKLVAQYLDKQSTDSMETDNEVSGYDPTKPTSYIFATDCTNEVKFYDFYSITIFSPYFSMENV